ncbi:MAG: hypothetical protein NVSMB52_20340 [Chloroflexota bacterium]
MRGDHTLTGALAIAATSEFESAELYHALLRSDKALASQTAQALSSALQKHRLIVQGRPLCNVLRPRFIHKKRSADLSHAANSLAALLERAGRLLLSSDTLLDIVGASDQEREMWAIDPGYEGFSVTSRLDAFIVGQDLKFLEYNAESPAGIGFCDRLTEIFNELQVMRMWSGQSSFQTSEARQHLLDTLLWCYGEWGGIGTPTIAIIDWDDVITKRDFELCSEYFQQHGIETVITDPRSLEYRGGALWCGELRISLVYRRVLLHELLGKSCEVKALLKAYADGAICMVNSPRSKLLHKKTVFAMLSDRRLGLPLSGDEEALVNRTIPWTRYLTSGETTYAGESVPMERLLRSKPEQFVLKPVDDYGGRGILLGWDTSEAEWERSLGIAFEGGYIVQERVSVPQAGFPIWNDGLEEVSLYLDTNPLMFRGHMGCILTRLSGSSLLNVTAGSGSAAPTFVLDDAEE